MKPFLFTQKERKNAYCSFCQGERSIARRSMNHWAYLVVTLLTGGLWGFVWLSTWFLLRRSKWRCRTCRHSVRLEAPPDSDAAGSSTAGTIGDEIDAEGLRFRLSPRTPRRFRDEAA